MNPEKQARLAQLKKDAESLGGGVFQVKSNTPSMLGSGYAGNTVVALPQKQYIIGDDLVWKGGPGGESTLHRTVAVKPGYVMTKGIFNQVVDGWIPIDRVLGKVVQVVREKD